MQLASSRGISATTDGLLIGQERRSRAQFGPRSPHHSVIPPSRVENTPANTANHDIGPAMPERRRKAQGGHPESIDE